MQVYTTIMKMAACRFKAWKILTNQLILNKQLSIKYVRCRQFSSSPEGNPKLNAVCNLYGALCIERSPVINREPTPLEKEFGQLLSVLEYEKSLLNDHELRHLNDLKRKNQDVNEDTEGVVMQTAQDIEDIWQAEYEKFQPAPRDVSGTGPHNEDRHSLKRLLDRKLVLVVKSKQFGDWRLPTSLYQPGETIRQTAERVLPEHFGSQLQAQIIGNAPVGLYKFEYSRKTDRKSIPNQAFGGKVFFFRAYLTKGDVTLDSQTSDVSDFAWLTAEELSDVFKAKKPYIKSIQNFLLEETFTYIPSTIYKKKYGKQLAARAKIAAVS